MPSTPVSQAFPAAIPAARPWIIRLGMQRDIDQYRNAEKQLEKDLENYLKDHSE